MPRLRLLAAAVAFLLPVFSPAQQLAPATFSAPSLDTKLPVDSKVRIGTLPNGIRYYIRQNAKPEKRAELRLVINAGSILENENQLGYAHIVEHTGFNGTRHFAKNDLIKYLESIGVRFGADLNAYTGFDETVFILPVPTDTARIIEQAFTILEDWAHGQIFDSTEVMNERGVVREEWRGGKGADERMLKQWLPVAFKGSRYAVRLPIGTEESIMGATPSKLRSFYQDWYRPDLMAVVAVGDFDVAQIEAQIKKHFSGIPARKNAPRRVSYDVPANKTPLVAIASDKEATSSGVNVIFKLPATSLRTVGDYRREIVERLYLQMLNDRFSEIAEKPDAPFLGASASKSSFFARTTEAFALAAGVKDGGIEAGLEALLKEARRVDQFGFLQSELDRAKQNLVRSYERAYAEREKTQSGQFADEYIRHFLEEEGIPGIEYEYKLVQSIAGTVTLAEVNQLARSWITDENRVIIAQTPVKTGVPVPTESGLLAVFDRASKAPIAAYAENLSTEALLANPPKPGKVLSTRTIASIGATEWKLSNGARVIVKPTDFKDDEVLVGAYSKGGTSLASDADVVSADLAAQIMGLSGVGTFNRIDLEKKLSGKAVGVNATISETTEGLNGRSSPKDLETLFQLIYLGFTSPRLDSVAFAAFKNQVTPFLANRGSSPEEVFRDTVQVTMSQHSVRDRPFTPAVFAEVNPAKSFAFYKDRFADASDFTFVFVGNVDTTTLKPYVEQYLASLPSLGRKESWRDTGVAPPKGVVQRTVRKGTEPKANTLIQFTGACVSTPENRFALRALTTLIQMRLNETLREKLGGTYSPNVGGGCSREPRPEYAISVSFGSSPENVEPLTKAVFALIDSLKVNPAPQSDIDKVKEQILRSREVETKQNSYWLTNILARDAAGEDLAGLTSVYDEMVKRLTPAQLQQAARQYFNTANYARFVLLPETVKRQ
ncbi:MAG TPA: insulinase family protein [Gemmatimonadaceae bacterium]|nr:insulinase family protein [Gemmatimonadaceae bacterium]